MRTALRFLIPVLFLLAALSPQAAAQFKKEAFSQDYSTQGSVETTDSEDADSSALFSFKEYFGALSHKNTTKIGTLAAGSAIFVGGQQIYNKQYWKLPIIYGGLAASIGAGFGFRAADKKGAATACFATGAAIYYATLFDGVVNFDKGKDPHPGRATLYSVLCPGLGQIYNGEIWKVPIYWSCMLGAGHFVALNQKNYKRWIKIYKEISDPNIDFTENISASTAEYYFQSYRRMRDYSILFLGGFYLLQAIDANVFCYMGDFELTDDLSMRVSPSVITPDCQYASLGGPPSYGLSIGFRF